MTANENTLSPRQGAVEAIRGALAQLHYYPGGSGIEVTRILARKLALAPSNFVLGNGSNDVLELVARAFLSTADSAVYSHHAFMVYPLAIQAIGARHVVVPARDFGADLDAMAKAIRADTKIVLLANPNNPTGPF